MLIKDVTYVVAYKVRSIKLKQVTSCNSSQICKQPMPICSQHY